MASIQWKTPSPLWSSGSNPSDQPFIAEFDGDNFIPDFLQLMTGKMTGKKPADLADAEPQDESNNVYKLYQPLHGRYYLITGSLVCRQLGLPDRAVSKRNSDTVSFVLRRSATVDGVTQEQGWVSAGANSGWRPLVDEKGHAVTIRADEERLPLHGVSVCSRRTVYYGYIPVSRRDQYLPKSVAPSGDPAKDLKDFMSRVDTDSGSQEMEYRLREVNQRVIVPWEALLGGKIDGQDAVTGSPEVTKNLMQDTLSTSQGLSLYMILDLADFLHRALPDVFQAIVAGSSSTLSGARKDLYDALGKINNLSRSGSTMRATTLREAIQERRNDLGLVNGQGTEPTDVTYDLQQATQNGTTVDSSYLEATLRDTYLKNALNEETATFQPTDEMTELLKDQVHIPPAVGEEYRAYLVYERKGCPPILSSQPSHDFTFAPPLDPDAPARHIRIELPSIKLKDLRKFKRGVGLQMSPELRDVMSRVNKGMLTGGDLNGNSQKWKLGMICTFSLQIIFLVAFIVMFIFLIALNFIFWWLPFLRICFPIPKKAS